MNRGKADSFLEAEQMILQAEKIWLYGAGIVAYGISKALKVVYDVETIGFIVSEITSDSTEIVGSHVLEVWSLEKQSERDLILIATPEIYHEEIINNLHEQGMNEYLLVDGQVEYGFMSRYYKKINLFPLLSDLEKQKSADNMQRDYEYEVYMACSIYDKEIKNNYLIPDWIKKVQAGAVLSEKKIASLSDHTGIHISGKNRNYAELTVTYWAWKNRKKDYTGICHYRRMLDMDERDWERIYQNEVDAVLPLPFVCRGDTSSQYGRYIHKDDLQVFWKALQEAAPDCLERAQEILGGRYLYNYNMIIAKDKVFDAYCAFLFSVLGKMEEIIKSRGMVRTDRYLGYFGELLTTIYFMEYKSRLKIVHTKRIWMV